MHAIRHVPDKYFISHVHILHIHILVSIDTLARKLNIFVSCLFEYQAAEVIGDTFIQMGDYFMT